MKLNKNFICFIYSLITIVSVKCEKKDVKQLKKTINKCCPKEEYVLDYEDVITCEEPDDLGDERLDFSDVPLYNADKTLTGNSVANVYNLAYGVLTNETVNELFFDNTELGTKYYLSEKGILFQESPNKFHWWIEQTSDKFCIDYKLEPENYTILGPSFWVYAGVRPQQNLHPILPKIYNIGMCISCFFLALTLLVYFLLPGTRTLSELVQMTYVASTLGAFLFLTVIMIPTVTYEANVCKGWSYITYFLFQASFCWMVVMSYDLWCLHCNLTTRTTQRKVMTRYRLYSIYAWSVPAVLSTFFIITNEADMKHIPWFTTPDIPNNGCFLNSEPKQLYLYIPMSILVLINWVFFYKTSHNLWKQYKITSTLDESYSTQKDHRTFKNRFFMYLKLSIIMGISWIMEVISSFQPAFGLCIVMDLYNMLIGFSIFLILVCNKITFKKLMKRYIKPNVSSTNKASLESSVRLNIMNEQ